MMTQEELTKIVNGINDLIRCYIECEDHQSNEIIQKDFLTEDNILNCGVTVDDPVVLDNVVISQSLTDDIVAFLARKYQYKQEMKSRDGFIYDTITGTPMTNLVTTFIAGFRKCEEVYKMLNNI